MIIRLPISCFLLNFSLSRKYDSSMTNTYVNVSMTEPYLMSTFVNAYVLTKRTENAMK